MCPLSPNFEDKHVTMCCPGTFWRGAGRGGDLSVPDRFFFPHAGLLGALSFTDTLTNLPLSALFHTTLLLLGTPITGEMRQLPDTREIYGSYYEH